MAEYVLLSEELNRGAGATAPAPPGHEISMDLEGIGPVKTYFVEVSDLDAPVLPPPDPSALQRLGGTLGMVGRGLPYALRLRRPAPVAR